MMTRFCFMLATLLLVAWQPLSAHTSPNTEIRLVPDENALLVQITVPASDYVSATRNAVSNDQAALEQAAEQVARRLSIEARDGEAWSIRVNSTEFTSGSGPADLNALVTARPEPGSSTQAVSLGWDMYPQNAPGHIAMVMMVDDAAADQEAQETLLGALTSRSKTLKIELDGIVEALPIEAKTQIGNSPPRSAVAQTFMYTGLVFLLLAAVALFAAVMRAITRRDPA